MNDTVSGLLTADIVSPGVKVPSRKLRIVALGGSLGG